jgi:hypothetical protein
LLFFQGVIDVPHHLCVHDQPVWLFRALPLFPNVRTLVIRRWHRAGAVIFKDFFLNLPPRDRRDLKELIISSYKGEEEVIDLS